MRQILHIFAKDARHFLPEILVSLAITAAFAWIYPNQWLQAEHGGPFVPQELVLLASCLTLLVPVSWWLLVSRVIHAENLVGDCQFWITRPYEWQKLLAAKALFLVCFLYLPIVLAQCFLLMQAGFHPLSYLPGLFYNLLLLTAVVVLPLFALSTITSSFARMTLTILGILLCFIAISALSAVVAHTSISDPLPDRVTLPLVLCGCIAVIVLQYFLRRTLLARLLLLALAVLLWAGSAVVPDEALIHRAYPRTSNTQFPSLQFPANASLDQPTANQARSPKQVGIRIPLQISGIANGYAWSADNVQVSIEGPHSLVWNSPWQSMRSSYYLPGTQDFFVYFETSRVIFDQLKSAPVTLHLTFAWTQLRNGRVQHVAVPTHDFVVPGFGVCSPAVYLATPSEIYGITCRYALHTPRLTFVNTLWSDDPCPSPGGIPGSGWTGGLDTKPADFSISTVWTELLPLTSNWNYKSDRSTKPHHICSGAPLTFTEYTLVQRTQSDFTIPNFRFPAYKDSSETGAGSIGIQVSPR